jgi:hypothetical protein
MFVQLIKGKLGDKERLMRAVERWEAELAPGATGWLGSTAGVTEDGTSFAVVRFESEQAAQANSDRPEQGEWWAEASQAFEGDVSFQNSSEVDVDTPGDPEQARFVQIMEGQGTNPDRARQLMAQDSDKWAAFRPDVLGSMVIHHGDGRFTMVMYFSSEEAAREGEKKEMPEELKANMDEMNSLMTGAPTFYDLKDPLLASP